MTIQGNESPLNHDAFVKSAGEVITQAKQGITETYESVMSSCLASEFTKTLPKKDSGSSISQTLQEAWPTRTPGNALTVAAAVSKSIPSRS